MADPSWLSGAVEPSCWDWRLPQEPPLHLPKRAHGTNNTSSCALPVPETLYSKAALACTKHHAVLFQLQAIPVGDLGFLGTPLSPHPSTSNPPSAT